VRGGKGRGVKSLLASFIAPPQIGVFSRGGKG